MATVLKTQRKKALRGVINEIEHNCSVSFIKARIDKEDITIASEMPKDELRMLNLSVGDEVDIFPIDIDTYLIIGKPQQYRNN